MHIPFEEFDALDYLGRGGFGTVYKTSLQSRTVAVKEFKVPVKEGKIVEKDIEPFISEYKQHEKLDHKRIIQLFGYSFRLEKTPSFYLVMEYADSGDLPAYLKKTELSWTEKKKLTIQIAEGIVYLHDEDVLHHDLHAFNILIHEGNVKIADFGLSRGINSLSKYKRFGITPFIDPQKLNDDHYRYDKKSDIYSFGVIMWVISSNGVMPFNGENEHKLGNKIIEGLREKPIKGTPMDFIDIYEGCWNHEPTHRPVAEIVYRRLKSMSLDPKYKDDDNCILI